MTRAMRETLVFLPAWNEERSIGAVLEELRLELPDADVLVVDDGSTDGTGRVAKAHNAEVLVLGENCGLRVAVPAGYRRALDDGYALCGRVDADGQHPAAELRRLLDRVRSGACDVAVGSRFASGQGYAPYRYRPSGARAMGTAVLRRAMRLRLGHSFADATSGMYAANRRALEHLAEPHTSSAPEVESLIRLTQRGLVVEEVPVEMRQRTSGASKLRGRTALKVVLTVGATLLLYDRFYGRRRAE